MGLRSERGPILLSIMMSTALVAIDSTILATAVPTIVADLGGFTIFPWLFTGYLLTQAVTVPIYAKLADTIGRKPVLLVGIGLFFLGSVLSGFSWSMPALIGFRALQGLGAGAVQPIAVTIAGDIYTVAERAKVQGYLASVWGISAVVGPTLGGVFSEFVSWRWIFFVNVPVCIGAAYLLSRHLHESVEHHRHRIDWTGAAVLTTGLTLIVLALLQGGHAWAWLSPLTLGSIVLGVGLLVVFVAAERRAAEPVLPLWVLSRRLLATASLISVAVGMILLGLTTYVPTFLETLVHVSPLVSGLTLATLTMGWPIASSQAGRLYLRLGFRTTILIGSAVVLVAAVALALVSRHPAVATVAVSCFVMGLGLGLVATPALIAAQASVDWGERGVVTGANMFARSMGSALGVAALGALVNGIMRGQDASADPHLFGSAATAAFTGVAVGAVLLTVVAVAMPRTPAPG